MDRVSKKARNIPPFIVMDVLEKARELERRGHHIIHLEIGEPDFPTPECICEAAREALSNGKTHYTHSLGIIELRESICSHFKKKYRVSVDPERVIVTSGTSPGLFMVFSALLEQGDEIIISAPHYPCYPNFAEFVGANPVKVYSSEIQGFQPTSDNIKGSLSRSTKAIMINSPSNPTGNMISGKEIENIAAFGIPVISDEIYHGLVYGTKEHSVLEFTQDAFILNGFSKLYAMTGWRLGYIIAPHEFIRPIQKIQQNLFISAGSVSQWAGVAALANAGEDVEKMKSIYNERRIYMLDRLRNLGFGLPVEPSGAFYMLANAKHISGDSYKLAFEILEKAGVGVTPGIDFGDNAEGYLRFSYANSLDNIKEGMDRIKKFLERR